MIEAFLSNALIVHFRFKIIWEVDLKVSVELLLLESLSLSVLVNFKNKDSL